MSGLRAFATALSWWALFAFVRGDGGGSVAVGLACLVAGALAGRALLGALLSLALVALRVGLESIASFAGTRTFHGFSSLSTAQGWWSVAPLLVAVALGIAAAVVARRASSIAGGRRDQRLAPAGGGWLQALADERPDLALRFRMIRKDWRSAAELGEALGMARTAARWWRAAGVPERARSVAARGVGDPRLELADAARHDALPQVEAAPRLELENPRTARFTIDPPEDES